MGWVYRAEPLPEPHQCTPPMEAPEGAVPAVVAFLGSIAMVPIGQVGDLWRCDECRKLGEAWPTYWRRAHWYTRLFWAGQRNQPERMTT